MKSPRLLVISDIHGHRTALVSLLEWLSPTSDDTIITLGDYVSGGAESRGVITELLNLKKQTHLIPLLGNHEVLMTQALLSQEMYDVWMKRGGNVILASYDNIPLNNLPSSHWGFINSCQRFHENKQFIFVHGTLDPALPLEEQPDEKLFFTKLTGNLKHISGKTIICGHTPQRNGSPLQYNNVVCIDTDIKSNSWLTCLEPASGKYWQTNPQGKRRKGVLSKPLKV